MTRAGLTTPNLRATVERARERSSRVRSVNAAPTAAEDRAALIDAALRIHALGLLLQDFPLAALGDVRADRPRHGRPRRGRPATIARRPKIRSSTPVAIVLVVGAGPAGLAAAAAAARSGRGRRSSSTTMPRSAASSSIAAGRSKAATGANGPRASRARRRQRRPGDDVDHGVRRLRPQSRLRLGAARAAARRALAHPAEADRGRRGRDRAAADRSRQRPPGRDVGRRRARLPSPLRRSGRPADRGRDQQRQRLSRRGGAGRGRGRGRDFRYPRRRARDAAERSLRRRDRGRRRRAPASTGVQVGGRTRPADALLLSGGWTPTVHLYAQARGKLRYDESLAALVPAARGRRG